MFRKRHTYEPDLVTEFNEFCRARKGFLDRGLKKDVVGPLDPDVGKEAVHVESQYLDIRSGSDMRSLLIFDTTKDEIDPAELLNRVH